MFGIFLTKMETFSKLLSFNKSFTNSFPVEPVAPNTSACFFFHFLKINISVGINN